MTATEITKGQTVTGHLTNPDVGRIDFTGTVTDVYRSGRDTIANVLCTDGVERSARPENLTPVQLAEPEWRTLKGITAPFTAYVHRSEQHGLWLARDRKQVDGEPVKVVRLEKRGSCRYGYTESGECINFWGAATRAWVTQ